MIGMHISIGTVPLNVRIVVNLEMLLLLLWSWRFPNCLFPYKLLDGRWSKRFSLVFVMQLPCMLLHRDSDNCILQLTSQCPTESSPTSINKTTSSANFNGPSLHVWSYLQLINLKWRPKNIYKFLFSQMDQKSCPRRKQNNLRQSITDKSGFETNLILNVWQLFFKIVLVT